MTSSRQVIHALGYAGLLPFVAPAIALALDIDHALLSLAVVNAYAFGIVCFLCGSWWGLALQQGHRAALVLSNALLLIAFFVFALANEWWPLGACLLLLALFAIEQGGGIATFACGAYRRMRAVLTLVAAGSMLAVHFAR